MFDYYHEDYDLDCNIDLDDVPVNRDIILNKMHVNSYKVRRYKKKTGADNKKAIINKKQADYIRSMKGQVRQVDLACEFGITQSMISHIQNRKYWK